MSDSISKWFETNQDIPKSRLYKPYTNRLISEGHKKEAYGILVEYSSEAILEAARILRDGE